MPDIRVERTGNCHSIASNEFRVHYPDGTVTLWSPPWNELDEDEEVAECLAVARRLFAEGRHQEKGSAGCADDPLPDATPPEVDAGLPA